MNITLYSNNCPRCNVLKKKLDNLGIDYSINSDLDSMIEKGFSQVPVLEVDEKIYYFTEANDLINDGGLNT